MIIGGSKKEVIANIRTAANARNLNSKVEINDPQLSPRQKKRLVHRHIAAQKTLWYRLCNFAARLVINIDTKIVNHDTIIEGLNYLDDVWGGAIITSNHFNPLANTVVRSALYRAGRPRLWAVSQESNLAMKGFLGFLMNYLDILPLTNSKSYMSETFPAALAKILKDGEWILIYPEQEMWFNYRKPRPPKRGAYYYAAQNNVPIIPFFVEIQNKEKKDNDEFYKVRYIVHIMPPIYPDPEKTVRENSRQMMQTDYRLKTEAYEKAYGKALDYDFEDDDIAGWIPTSEGDEPDNEELTTGD